MKQETMLKKLNEKYPDGNFFIRDGHVVGGEQSYLKETVEDVVCETPLFDYYEEYDIYELGVLVDLARFVEKFGFYWEPHDPGTYILYEV
jgi:hypothetical protein